MRVLVAGATGAIGRPLISALVASRRASSSGCPRPKPRSVPARRDPLQPGIHKLPVGAVTAVRERLEGNHTVQVLILL